MFLGSLALLGFLCWMLQIIISHRRMEKGSNFSSAARADQFISCSVMPLTNLGTLIGRWVNWQRKPTYAQLAVIVGNVEYPDVDRPKASEQALLEQAAKVVLVSKIPLVNWGQVDVRIDSDVKFIRRLFKHIIKYQAML